MAPRSLSWDALPEELLQLIGARLRTLRCYIAARGVCRTWRADLLAVSPCLFHRGEPGTSAVHSLPMQGSFDLPKHHDGYCYKGASGGWLAVTYRSGSCYGEGMSEPKPKTARREEGSRQHRRRGEQGEFPFMTENPDLLDSRKRKQLAAKEYHYRNFDGAEVRMQRQDVPEVRRPGRDKWRMSLLNPVTGKHIVLPEHVKLDPYEVTMVAFAPNPSVSDYTAVATYDTGRLAYVSTRDTGRDWSFGEIISTGTHPVVITDMLYREGPPGGGSGDKVYCLTRTATCTCSTSRAAARRSRS